MSYPSKRIHYLIPLVAFVGMSVQAQNAGAPSVESFNRNLTQPGVLIPRSSSGLDASAPMPASSSVPSGGMSVFVSGFLLNGVTVFDTAELLAAAGVTLQTHYDLAGLQAVADAITLQYRKAGYLVARAWLSPQAIDNHVITLQVFEGHLSATEPYLVNAAPELDVGLVRATVQQNLCGDTGCAVLPLTQQRVERATLLAGEVSGYRVQGQLMPGKELGSTRLALDVMPRDAFLVEAGVDNFGSKATGVNRAQMRLAANHVLQTGDQLVMAYLTTNKSDMRYDTLDYSLPVGVQGWRVGAGAGKTQYNLPAFAGYAGTAHSSTAYASYPLVRSAQRNLDWRVDYEATRLSDHSTISNDRHLDAWRVGISGDFQDAQASDRPALNNWALAATQTNLGMSDGSVGATSGSRVKYTGRWSRIQSLTPNGWYAAANTYGQHANGNLDAYSKLFLGGANAVRAYAGGEVGGDSAAVGQFSVGKNWTLQGQGPVTQLGLSAFYDRGWARLQKDPSQGVASNQQARAGHGLELQISQKDSLSVRAFVAKGETGASSVDGKNHRVGISLGLSF